MKKLLGLAGLLICLVAVVSSQSNAVAQDGGFSLQVTPSPLIATIEPGQQSNLEVRVRNGNSSSERLKMELRSFSVDGTSGQINIGDNVPEDVASFVSFKEPVFNIDAGQWYTQDVIVNTPKNAGFSYSFVILISREKQPQKVEGTNAIEGSVALFTLLNTNRPDATKKLTLKSFVSARKVYEYLPTHFDLAIENSGNTIVQPKGNIFIGRSGDESSPLAALQINPNGGYIIPASSRTLSTEWNDGFPNNNDQNKRVWNWSKLSNFRIGKYTAKAVLIYDDGQRDIPIESELTFWVIPWKILLVLFVVVTLVGIGLYTIIRRSYGMVKQRPKNNQSKPDEAA